MRKLLAERSRNTRSAGPRARAAHAPRAPVSTIFPEVKSSIVHCGDPSRIVMAANFCFSYTELGMKRLITSRFRPPLLFSWHVPTRLCTCATADTSSSRSAFSMYSSSMKTFL